MSTAPDPVRIARSRLARAHVRSAGTTPEEFATLRRDLTAAKLERHVREVVATAPPLTDEQRNRLAALLTGGDVR